MFTIKERCTLHPLATSGPFAKPFVVEVELSVFNMKTVLVSVFSSEEDGTERKLATGKYEIKPDMLKSLESKLREKLGGEGQ